MTAPIIYMLKLLKALCFAHASFLGDWVVPYVSDSPIFSVTKERITFKAGTAQISCRYQNTEDSSNRYRCSDFHIEAIPSTFTLGHVGEYMRIRRNGMYFEPQLEGDDSLHVVWSAGSHSGRTTLHRRMHKEMSA